MSPRRRPPVPPRRARIGAVVLASGLLAVGCGGEPAPEAESYLLTDLAGGTAAPSADIGAPTSTATPTPVGEPLTGADLIARIGEAVVAFDSVVITRGTGTPPPDLRAGVTYGSSDDFTAAINLGPGVDALLVERVDGTLYVGNADNPPQPVGADDVRSGAGGSLPALLAWSPLLDLRAVLTGAGPVTEVVVGSEYGFDVDLGSLPRPSTIVPDQQQGSATATLTLDEDALPVRLKISYDETDVVLAYSEWGAPVELTVS